MRLALSWCYLACVASAQAPPSVDGLPLAVLEFTTGSAAAQEDAQLGKGLQAMLTTDLSRLPGVRVLERARLVNLLAEQELGRSGLVDRKTAARIGKLVGAAHLVAGAYTISGERMRIDFRLFEVATGEVRLAQAVEGEAAAFFELEKELVSLVAKALELHPTPRQRAAIARIHTADLQALLSFSRGLGHFDAKRYDQALVALREAVRADDHFELAALTLTEYERVVRDLRTRADATEQTFEKEAKTERERARSGRAAVARRLRQIASDARRDGVERATALQLLAARRPLFNYEIDGLPHQSQSADGSLGRAHQVRDAGDYYQLAAKLFPVVPLFAEHHESLVPPDSPEALPAALKRAEQVVRERVRGRDKAEAAEAALGTIVLSSVGARRMGMDYRSEVELLDHVWRLGLKLLPHTKHAGKDSLVEGNAQPGWYPPSYWWRARDGGRVAASWRRVGELDRSTAVLRTIAGWMKDPVRLRELADEIAANARIKATLDADPDAATLRELLLYSSGYPGHIADRLERAARGEDQHMNRELWRGRTLEKIDANYFYLGDQRVWWALRKGLSTGPRTDRRRAAALRYVGGKMHRLAGPALVIVDGHAQRDFELRLEVDYAGTSRASRPKLRGKVMRPPPERARVALAFDLNGLNEYREVRIRGRLVTKRVPTVARVFAIAEQGVTLADTTRPFVRHDRAKRWTASELAQQRAQATAAEQLTLTLRVVGRSALLRVGAETLRFELPERTPGLVGLMFSGSGRATVRKLSLTPLPVE